MDKLLKLHAKWKKLITKDHIQYGSIYLKVQMKVLSCVRLFASPQTVAYQAPLSMQFSRQEYQNG